MHQTPEPVALCGSDRNFYDRYFFSGFTADGACYFAVAFGVYPNLNLADAHFSVVLDGVQYCLHASRYLYQERMNLQVGPIRIEVLEPLQRLRVVVEAGHGIEACLEFVGRAFPIQEPRFTHRFGTRTFMDLTRLTQNCRCSGWITVDGRRVPFDEGSLGTRDRSWGVRPLGAADTQPLAPSIKPSVFWVWAPVHFPNHSVFFHVMADEAGAAWNTHAVICPDGAQPSDMQHSSAPEVKVLLQPGTRHAAGAQVFVPVQGQTVCLSFERIARFQMKGIGYGHPSWAHGTFKGELMVEREDYVLSDVNPLSPENVHVQDLSRVTMTNPDGSTVVGMGIFEMTIVGDYLPLGLK